LAPGRRDCPWLSSGRKAGIPGMYFCGYRISPTGMLREIAEEARHISAEIARKDHRNS
jgi:hypothetical protein